MIKTLGTVEVVSGFNIDIAQKAKPNKVKYSKPEMVNGRLFSRVLKG